jgi:hypothetical protein
MKGINMLKCCLCGKEILPNAIGWDQGNNPDPIPKERRVNDSDRCCDDCDSNVVIPERIRQIKPDISEEDAREIGKIAHQPIPPEFRS